MEVALSETGQTMSKVFIKKITQSMLNVTTIKFAINENVVWDIMSKFEQEFSSKKEVHHACL